MLLKFDPAEILWATPCKTEYEHIKSLGLKLVLCIYRLSVNELGMRPPHITSYEYSIKIGVTIFARPFVSSKTLFWVCLCIRKSIVSTNYGIVFHCCLCKYNRVMNNCYTLKFISFLFFHMCVCLTFYPFYISHILNIKYNLSIPEQFFFYFF